MEKNNKLKFLVVYEATLQFTSEHRKTVKLNNVIELNHDINNQDVVVEVELLLKDDVGFFKHEHMKYCRSVLLLDFKLLSSSACDKSVLFQKNVELTDE